MQPGSDVIVCAEMDEQWGYVGAKSRQRWLFYAYDRLRKTVVAHVFGERTMATLGRLMSLLSPFDVVIWMTDGWPLYESRLKGKLHVISKRYTQRIERHNLNLRQHLARLGRKSDVIVCAEMDEQWGYVGAKSRQRWLFYAYDRLRKTVVAHVFGERTMATLGRLMSLLSPFDVVIWMTDGWPLYESRLKGKLHVISKRYTQRIERHNLNLRQHLARLGRKSLSFSKSVELHDKVIGHYLNIKHYQ
ncbi:IS1 family transposase [Kluyvera georgiana]|uniref:IS1 family transposase n=1 Tax=Kluyvera georgiana TaxID=73098 RepID=UPI003F66D8A1